MKRNLIKKTSFKRMQKHLKYFPYIGCMSFLIINSQSVYGQGSEGGSGLSNSYTIPNIERSLNKFAAEDAFVISTNENGDPSKNENFYVSNGDAGDSLGSTRWWSGVNFEVQTDGGVGTRDGLFMDWGDLYLVADWDNTSGSEDIVFGFDSNLKNSVNERMRLTDGGKLGIGTASPKKQLHVTGDIYAKGHLWLHSYFGDGLSGTAYLQARDDSGTSSIGLQLRTQNAGSHVNALRIVPNGNIGIGTVEPTEKLQVNGNILATGDLILQAPDADQSGVYGFKATTEGLQLRTRFNGFPVEALKVDTAGNVGIGTTAPTEVLEVQGNIKIGDQHTLLLEEGAIADNKSLYLIGDRNNDSETEDIIFGFHGTENQVDEKMRLNDKGYLGIGTITPTEKLEVEGKIKAHTFVTSARSFPDYVFAPEYKKTPLTVIETYVKKHRHLPNMPSENEVVSHGMDMKEIAIKSVENIEEIFLHLIEMEKRIQKLENENKSLRNKVSGAK